MWTLSYLASNWEVVLLVVLGTLALGAIAWFSRNWKVAVAAVVLVAAGFAYQHIDRTAYQRAVNEQKQRELAVKDKRIATLENLSVADAKRALADADTIDQLRKQADETPANAGQCLPADAADRVQRVR